MRQSIRALLLAAALLCVASLAFGATAPLKNLLLNPGFEKNLGGHEWMPTSWDTSDAGLSTVFFGRDSFLVHSGTHAVSIANTSTIYPMAHNWNQTLLVGREAWGKDAVLSVWSRSNGLQGRAYVMLQAYRDTLTKMSLVWGVDRDAARRRMGVNKVDDPAIDFGWKRQQFDDAQSDWVRREVRVYVPAGTNVLFVRMGLFGTGQVLYDDASLTLETAKPAVAPAPGVNLFTDPGFENNSLAWELVVPPFEGARLDRDSTVAHTGRYSMRCSNMADGLVQTRMGITQPIPARALAGKHVRLSGWFKGDSLRATAYVKIFSHSKNGIAQTPGKELLSGTFDWTKLDIDYDVPAGTVELWPWLVFNAPAAGMLWFDDAELTVVGPAASSGKKP